MVYNGTADYKARLRDYFRSRTPVYIVNKGGDWISGYITDEPNHIFCVVLDSKEKEHIEVHYSEIKYLNRFKGNIASLPLPKYLQTKGELKADNNSEKPVETADVSHSNKKGVRRP